MTSPTIDFEALKAERHRLARAIHDAADDDMGNILVIGCEGHNYCDPVDAAWATALLMADAVVTDQSARIAELVAQRDGLVSFVTNVAEPHHASDHYSMATAFERFQTRARALLDTIKAGGGADV